MIRYAYREAVTHGRFTHKVDDIWVYDDYNEALARPAKRPQVVPNLFYKKRLGLLFTALNGNELFLPITSFCNGKDYTVEYHGLYLSATPCGSNNVYSLHFDQHKASILGRISRNESFFVKLIKRGR